MLYTILSFSVFGPQGTFLNLKFIFFKMRIGLRGIQHS